MRSQAVARGCCATAYGSLVGRGGRSIRAARPGRAQKPVDRISDDSVRPVRRRRRWAGHR